MPISDIMGIRQALENIKEDKDILKRHERLSKIWDLNYMERMDILIL